MPTDIPPRDPTPATRASPVDERAAPAVGGMRVSRGGAWLNVPQWCRAASRNRNFALLRVPHVGIRLAKDLPAP